MSRGVVFGPTCCDGMVLHWAISLKTNSRQCWLAPEVAIMTTLDVVCDDNVGIMTNLGVQWLFKTPKCVVCGRYEASTQREERVSYFLSWIWTFDYITKYYCGVWHRNCRTGLKLENYYFFIFTFSRPEVRKLLLFYVFTFSRPEVRKLLLFYVFTFSRPEVRKLFRIYFFTFSRPEVGKLFRTFSFFLNLKLENYSIFRWRSARLQ